MDAVPPEMFTEAVLMTLQDPWLYSDKVNMTVPASGVGVTVAVPARESPLRSQASRQRIRSR